MAEIRADLSAWLAQPEQTELRELVLVSSAVAAPVIAPGNPTVVGRVPPRVPAVGEGQNLGAVPAPQGQQARG